MPLPVVDKLKKKKFVFESREKQGWYGTEIKHHSLSTIHCILLRCERSKARGTASFDLCFVFVRAWCALNADIRGACFVVFSL
jgi:hypothetical protein